MRPSCALLVGFVIGARVSLLWQHTRLMQDVSEDACTHCMAVGILVGTLKTYFFHAGNWSLETLCKDH